MFIISYDNISEVNNNMKKVFKTIGKILLGIVSLIILCLFGIFIYHRVCSTKEDSLFDNPPVGQFVEVDGHKMNVYTYGEGEDTLVFLAGAFTTSPILDFKEFTDQIKDNYRIVIIEKFGYGFSDITDDERTTDIMVEQNRKALVAAGIDGPYILCPHSFSGLEAIYWAQNYPDEVRAIIGLDMAVSDSYKIEDYTEENVTKAVKTLKIYDVARNVGIVRLFAKNESYPEYLSDVEKTYIIAIASRGYMNKTIQSEVRHINDDVELVDEKQVPDVPTLLLISDGSGTTGERWINSEMDYASNLSRVKTVQLNCGHAVYHEKPEEVINEMKAFIEVLDIE